MQFNKSRNSCTAAGTRKLFKMMLGTDSEFVNKFFAARKYWDINVGQWTASGGAPLHPARMRHSSGAPCVALHMDDTEYCCPYSYITCMMCKDRAVTNMCVCLSGCLSVACVSWYRVTNFCVHSTVRRSSSCSAQCLLETRVASLVIVSPSLTDAQTVETLTMH